MKKFLESYRQTIREFPLSSVLLHVGLFSSATWAGCDDASHLVFVIVVFPWLAALSFLWGRSERRHKESAKLRGPSLMLIAGLLMLPPENRAAETTVFEPQEIPSPTEQFAYYENPYEHQLGGSGGAVGGAVVRIVATCAASYCVYRLAKFCQQKFGKGAPPRTNRVDEVDSWLEGPSSYGGAFNIDELGSCFTPGPGADLTSNPEYPPVVYNMWIYVEEDDEGVLDLRSDVLVQTGEEFVQDWKSFRDEVQESYGVTLTSGPSEPNYAVNGVAVPPEEARFHFDPITQTVTYQRGHANYYTITVEASEDMEEWSQVMSFQIEVGSTILFQDVSTEGKQFYRMSGALSD